MRVENPTAAPVEIQEFGPGDHTFVVLDGAKLVHVLLIAGGAGGMQGTHGVYPGDGGIGGRGGGLVSMQFPAVLLPGEVSLNVGVGGQGGTGSTTDAGTDGTSGGATSFGSFLAAPGGMYARREDTPSMLPSSAPVPAGGSSGIIVDIDGLSLDQSGTPGSAWSLTLAAALGPTADGTDGADGTTSALSAPGVSGSGGGASLTGDGGNGGHGGNYGSGGGGGGCCPDGYLTGDGGNGGDGIAIITTYF